MTHTITLPARTIRSGRAEGPALVSSVPIGFLGGVDPDTGVVLEPLHPLQGQSVKGTVLVFSDRQGQHGRLLYDLAPGAERRRTCSHRQ